MKLKTSVKIIGSVLILLAAISIATPFITKSQLKNWLLENGATSVAIERLYLNIWTGRLELQGLNAHSNEQDALNIGLLETDISYRSLWKKRFQIDSLNLKNSQLPIKQHDKGWDVGPLSFPTDSSSESAKSSDNPWHWGLSQISISNLTINGLLQEERYQLTIDSSQLRLLYNWLPDQDSFFSLKGKLNDSPFAIDSQGTPLSETASGELKLKIDQLALQSVLKPWAPEIQGILSSDLTLNVSQSSTGLSLQQSGSLLLTQAKFKQADLNLNSEKIDWKGNSRIDLGGQNLKTITVDGDLALDKLHLIQSELDLNTESILWRGKRELAFKKGLLTNTNLEGDLVIKAISLIQNQLTLKSNAIAWKGSNKLQFDNQLPRQVDSVGQLSLDAIDLQQAQLNVQSQQIQWQGSNQLTLAEEQQPTLINDGKLKVMALALQQPGTNLKESQVNWEGNLSGALDKKLSAKGAFSTAPSILELGAIRLNSQARRWQGEAVLDMNTGLLSSLSGNAALEQIELQAKDKTSLAKVGKVIAENLSAEGENQVGIGKLTVNALDLAHKKPLLKLSNIIVDKAILGAQSAQIAKVQLGALETEVSLNKDGKPASWLAWQSALGGDQKSQKAPSTADKDRTPFHFSLENFRTTAPAKVLFSDDSVNAKDIKILIEKLSLAKINTRSTEPGPFEVGAKVNRFGALDVKGNYSWMSPTPNGDWKGALSNLELPPFSPYMQRHSGYQIKSGQFNIDTGGTVKSGVVDSLNKVKIQNLDVTQAKESDTEGFNKKLGMPLETAISILTDDDNNVSLDIPVSGSIDDPEFGYQSVVNIIMGKVAKEGAISYLTTALQPYGALISLGRMLANSASKNAVDLEPISFLPGSSALSDSAKDYLGKISDLLKSKEGIRLNLCGYAVTADKQAIIAQTLKKPTEKPASVATASSIIAEPQLKERLNTLAQERSENVKQYLLETGKVKAERLFSCLPEVDLKSDLPPRVGMGL